MRFPKLVLVALAILLSLAAYSPTLAQDGEQDEPYYIVQEGDSLWEIAARFGVDIEDLQQANNISDPGQVVIGARLVIPGLEGISGELSTITVAYGETLRSLSRQYGISEKILARLNRLVSPGELYAGSALIVPIKENQNSFVAGRANLSSAQSLLEFSVAHGNHPWSLTLENNLVGTWSALPADLLRVAGASQEDVWSGLPGAITKVEINPLQMSQGGTTVIKVYAQPGIVVRGSLAERNLNFFPQEYGYVALQGIHAMTTPGRYPLALEVELPDGKRFAFSQDVIIQNVNFPYDPSLNVDPVTIDPAVTEPENELWVSLGVPVTPEKIWDGLFASPVPADFKECWTSFFGTRRSYNAGPYASFHSGLDFCGRVGTELYATASGRVVYTDSLIVRGGVVVIDHGWGVYTAYDHLSEILVQPGETVQPGQLIALGGDTGRTTGPHLHWEVWVGGVQVNPVDWLNRAYP